MDLKNAYDILGVPEDSLMEEVEKRVDLLIRRLRASHTEEDQVASTQIMQAYKVIQEYNRQVEIERYNIERFGMDEKKKLRREKTEHFWNYYRWHVIVSLIAVVVIVMIANTVIDARKEAALPPPELEVMLYGNYDAQVDLLETTLLQRFPQWERVKITLNYFPGLTINNTLDSLSIQKNFLVLMTEKPDVYILDQDTFEGLVNKDLFASLDEIRAQLGSRLTDEQLLIRTNSVDNETHLYGIDVSDSSYWDPAQISGAKKILAVRIGAKNQENVQKWLDSLVQE